MKTAQLKWAAVLILSMPSRHHITKIVSKLRVVDID